MNNYLIIPAGTRIFEGIAAPQRGLVGGGNQICMTPGNSQCNVGADMNNCPWEEINGFQSPGEFQRFERWIAEQIQLGNAEEVLVNFELRGPYWHQRWFPT